MKPANGSPWQIFRLESVPSTNSYVSERVQALDNLSVVTARCQSEGRGQRGNRWVAGPGENLTFSVLLKLPEGRLEARRQMRLTALATVALRECLREDYGIPAVIKWPNDIYVRDRKICGMLIENGLTGHWITHSILGIGLNVNQTAWDPSLLNPTSMRRVTGQSYDLDEVLRRFLGRLQERLPDLTEESLWQDYTDGLYRAGERYPWSDVFGRIFYGTIKGVRKDGRLEILCDDGILRRFAFKEVQYVL